MTGIISARHGRLGISYRDARGVRHHYTTFTANVEYDEATCRAIIEALSSSAPHAAAEAMESYTAQSTRPRKTKPTAPVARLQEVI